MPLTLHSVNALTEEMREESGKEDRANGNAGGGCRIGSEP